MTLAVFATSTHIKPKNTKKRPKNTQKNLGQSKGLHTHLLDSRVGSAFFQGKAWLYPFHPHRPPCRDADRQRPSQLHRQFPTPDCWPWSWSLGHKSQPWCSFLSGTKRGTVADTDLWEPLLFQAQSMLSHGLPTLSNGCGRSDARLVLPRW